MNDTIKSFLVGLSFGVDDSSLSKFNKAIQTASARVAALYASIKVLSAGIFWSISKISEGFEQMGYEYRIIAPAINKTLVLRRELLKAYAMAGVDITRTIQQSVKFNMALAKTQFAFKAIAASVASKFFPLLTKQMDIFRSKIYANMPKIQATIEKFVMFVFKAFDATVQLGTRIWSILQRIYDFFYRLHEVTGGWSTAILAVYSAWRFLNLAFLATPLGMLITGFLTLIALFDDFMVWREGGESLIDWGSRTTKVIVGIVGAVTALAAAIYTVRAAMVAFQVVMSVILPILKAVRMAMVAFSLVAALNPFGLLVVGAAALIALLAALIVKWDTVKEGLASFFGGLGDKILGFAGGIGDWVSGGGVGKALGSDISNTSTSNQNVQQQTQINVMGSADAQATASAVASQQTRVNFDMVRNLKGAAR